MPDKDKLASFLSAAKTLDVPTVASLLDERLALALPGEMGVCLCVWAYGVVTNPAEERLERCRSGRSSLSV